MAELILPSGHIALVDDDDVADVIAAGPWYAARNGYVWYVCRRLPGTRKTLKLHGFLTGYPMTDHANGNGLDNRRANLRPANALLNAANSRKPKNNTSGFKGVTWLKSRRRWQARITQHGRNIYLGNFTTPEDAARAYDTAAVELFGEYARPNFPRAAS